ncbi:MAG: ABC transporter permease [Planctomycetota bacterium]
MTFSTALRLVRASMVFCPGRVIAVSVALGCTSMMFLLAMLSLQSTHRRIERLPGSLLRDREIFVVATDPIDNSLSERWWSEIESDDRVATIQRRWRARAFDLPATEDGSIDQEAFFRGPLLGWIPGKSMELVACQGQNFRGELFEGRWPSIRNDNVMEVVVPQHQKWSMQIGDLRRLESDAGAFLAKVVGFSKLPDSFVASDEARRLHPWYVCDAGVQRLAGGSISPSEAFVELRNAKDKSAFLRDWLPELAILPGRIECWDSELIRSRARDAMELSTSRIITTFLLVLTSAGVICMAISLQWTSMDEKREQTILLRRLGLGRRRLFTVDLLESLIDASLGLAVAIALSWMLIWMLPVLRLESPMNGPSLAATAAVLVLGLLAGRLSGSMMAGDPTRLELGDRLKGSLGSKQVIWNVALASILVALGASLVIGWASESIHRANVLAWVTLPLFFLLSVMVARRVVRVVNRVLARPMAFLTRVDSLVLSNLSIANETRMTGSVLSISVGLSAFLWMMIWGASMLRSFVIDPEMPRWMVSIYPYGLDADETSRVLQQPEFRQMEPLVLLDSEISWRTTSDEAVDGKTSSGGSAIPTLIVAARPSYISEELPISFRDGPFDLVLEQVSRGDHCLVDSWFADSFGLSTGDEVSLAVPGWLDENRIAKSKYTIAGIIDLPGWLMSTKQNKTRRYGRPHEAMVMLAIDPARSRFRTAHANYFLGDPARGITGKIPVYPSGVRLDEGIEATMDDRTAMSQSVARVVDLKRPIEHLVGRMRTVTLNERSVQTDDLDRVRDALNGPWGAASVQRLGWLPLLFLGLSLLSVTGNLMSAMRSRAHELGILRSLGVSRWALQRLALAESLLQTISSILIACLTGFGGAWISLQISRVVGLSQRWQGIQTDVTVPWAWLGSGWLLTLVIVLVSAWVVGRRIGRAATAGLLRGVIR